ncbi:hypothetical protein AMTRI_Chr09g39860 [Amborella trichopoda]
MEAHHLQAFLRNQHQSPISSLLPHKLNVPTSSLLQQRPKHLNFSHLPNNHTSSLLPLVPKSPNLYLLLHKPISPNLSLLSQKPTPLAALQGDNTPPPLPESNLSSPESDLNMPESELPVIRFRRGSRRRLKQQDGDDKPKPKAPPPKKDWESMNFAEKAAELYVGEKGVLFWLNKAAYASIFVVVGGWILFRFVGPSLGLYQLDSPPLPPSTMVNN